MVNPGLATDDPTSRPVEKLETPATPSEEGVTTAAAKACLVIGLGEKSGNLDDVFDIFVGDSADRLAVPCFSRLLLSATRVPFPVSSTASSAVGSSPTSSSKALLHPKGSPEQGRDVLQPDNRQNGLGILQCKPQVTTGACPTYTASLTCMQLREHLPLHHLLQYGCMPSQPHAVTDSSSGVMHLPHVLA